MNVTTLEDLRALDAAPQERALGCARIERSVLPSARPLISDPTGIVVAAEAAEDMARRSAPDDL